MQVPFGVCRPVVRSVVFVIQVALDEQVRVVSHCLVNSGVLPWVVQGPESCSSAREAAVKSVSLEKGDQVAGVFDEWVDI